MRRCEFLTNIMSVTDGDGDCDDDDDGGDDCDALLMMNRGQGATQTPLG